MRAPDVVWIRREKLIGISKKQQKKFLPACPDFVIELRSESATLSELQEKMEEWIANGTQLGWLINPKKKQTYVYQPNENVAVQDFATDLSGEKVLEGSQQTYSHFLSWTTKRIKNRPEDYFHYYLILKSLNQRHI